MSYFHHHASHRRQHNRITKSKDENSNWITSLAAIGKVATSFFSSLFSSEASQVDYNVLFEGCRFPHLTDQQHNFLASRFTSKEVWEAVNSIHPTKDPRPNGYHARFYQVNWTTIGSSIIDIVLRCLNDGLPFHEINETFITLIPKLKSSESMVDYQPIGLCNVLYKILSKVLVNRIKPILKDLISETHSSFVSQRLITDNIIVASEVFHWLTLSRKICKKDAYALKIDMRKVYDRVEWSYLRWILHMMNFPNSMIGLIMHCVSSVSFRILLNGEPMERFVPSHGLRQGDPLSLYLFILCAEGFSTLINHAVTQGLWSGIQIGKHAPHLSHLFFADDYLLFMQDSDNTLETLLMVIEKYESVSGQKINIHKYEIFFSKHMLHNRK